MPRKSLLIVSATYVTEENRKKLLALNEHFDLTCATCEKGGAFGLPVSARGGAGLAALPAVGDVLGGTRYFLRGLGRVLRERRYDIILAEAEPWSFIRWQTWWWKRLLQPGALFGEFSWENMERRGAKGLALSFVYRAAIATGDFVIAGSRDAGALFTERGMRPVRILVAPQLGLDEALFAPAGRPEARRAMGVPADCFLAGYCGRFTKAKGIADLVEAVELARRRSDIRLALLGDGDCRPAAREWLHILPPRRHPDIASFMQALDLFVLPSRETREGGVCWKEQFGHVLIEAMGCGVAALGSDSGAIPEVLGGAAQLFPEGGVEALAERILFFHDNPAARERIARAGRERVLERYTNTAVAARWAAFLHAIPARTPPRS